MQVPANQPREPHHNAAERRNERGGIQPPLMLSSFTLQTPRKVARIATVTATNLLRRARALVAASSEASPADSMGSISIMLVLR